MFGRDGDCVHATRQDRHFNGNPLIEVDDWNAPAAYSNVGAPSNMKALPTEILIPLSSQAVTAIDCSSSANEVQFRLTARNISNNFHFSNFDDT